MKNLNAKYIYYGSSMAGLFRNGDRILAQPQPWESLETGDIIIFNRNCDRRMVIHRIIRRNDAILMTQGDNNLKPDPAPVTRHISCLRVSGYHRDGKPYSIAGGKRGLREFRRRQRRLQAGIWLRTICRPLKNTAPLSFLRFVFPALHSSVFGDWECIYSGKRLVARKKSGTECWHFAGVIMRLFFSRRQLRQAGTKQPMPMRQAAE